MDSTGRPVVRSRNKGTGGSWRVVKSTGSDDYRTVGMCMCMCRERVREREGDLRQQTEPWSLVQVEEGVGTKRPFCWWYRPVVWARVCHAPRAHFRSARTNQEHETRTMRRVARRGLAECFAASPRQTVQRAESGLFSLFHTCTLVNRRRRRCGRRCRHFFC